MPIVSGLSNEDYHARPEISKSGLDLIAEAPAVYDYAKRNPRPSTPAQRLGTLTHLAILEPELFAKSIAYVPEDAPKYPSSAQWGAKNPSPETVLACEWWRDFEASVKGKEIVTIEEREKLVSMQRAVWKHAGASKILTGMLEVERSYFTELEGVKVRVRPDAISALNWTGDLKTSADASPKGFAKSVANFRYHVQDAFYTDARAKVERKPQPFVFIVVETHAPFLVATYVLPPEVKAEGRRLYKENLATYRECKKSGVWPGYAEEIVPIEMPRWAMPDDFERERFAA